MEVNHEKDRKNIQVFSCAFCVSAGVLFAGFADSKRANFDAFRGSDQVAFQAAMIAAGTDPEFPAEQIAAWMTKGAR